MRRACFLISLLVLGLAMAGLGRYALACADFKNEEAPVQAPSFQEDVRPLFQAKCLRCHGAKAHRADLDLSTPAGILKGGESGAVIVAGKPEQSPLYEKVHGGTMPPGKKDRLSDTEVDTIRRWIAAGAKFGPVESTTTEPTLTQHDVLPILLRRCTVCHGLRRQEANLDLRSKSSMLRGGKSGPAMVLGKPEESLLIKKVRAGQMPPRERLVEVSVKPIEPTEIETMAKWIAAGAPEVAMAPDVATTTPDPLVSDKDREFWAFRAPQAVTVPAVPPPLSPPLLKGGIEGAVRNPIDAFILHKLEQKGLTLAPEADRATLLRRAYLDLTGLPPEPAEVQAFLADRAPDAYERLVDRLLASPRYGERWGRFWLDLAGYADSEGKREQDLPRPYAWRYRDYVIRAFNADKPYDRFLLEQLAGDELADYEHAAEITPELYDNLVATGFLRMAPDATWANITGFLPDRLEVIADEIDVLGSAVMGLTLKCARCHSHKFDPLPQRDYYRLAAVFKGAFDEYDWLKPDVRPGLGPVSQDVLGGRHLPFVITEERRDWQKQNSQAKGKLPEPRIHALWDRGEPSPTYIYRRGDPLSPGKLVGPGVPSVLTDGKTPFEVKQPWPGAKSTGRRLAFARWLTQPDHPLTARVAVNRLWKHHFGTGIVKTLGNFGKAGTLPTHPELLDWLARYFVSPSPLMGEGLGVRALSPSPLTGEGLGVRAWSIKSMHRLMMTSATYRQSSAVTTQHEKLDPDNALYSRMPLVRLNAEALYDSLLLVAGRLDETRFGPGDAVTVRSDGLATPQGTARGWRRMIYVQQARKRIPTHLENFDYPQMNPNCLERRDSTVAPQALHMMNNGMVQQLAEQFAQRVSREAGADPAKRIERVYLIALSRLPSDEERQIGLDSLGKLTEQWTSNLATPPMPPLAKGGTGPPMPPLAKGGKGGVDRDVACLKALMTYCHAIMNSASFLYVD